MNKKALILGCSHAAGAEMWLHPDNKIKDPVEQVEFGGQNSYPAILAEMLGYTAHNHAISGGSNDSMFRVAVEQISSFSQQDIVIACWTGWNRTELWHEDSNVWIPMCCGDLSEYTTIPNSVLKQGININVRISNINKYVDYSKNWALYEGNDQRGQLNKIKNILAVNQLAESHGIKIINIDSFHRIDNYQWPESIKWISKDFMNFCSDCQYSHTDWGHYYQSAHLEFARYIVNSLVDQ
jgi:hypothetical protein